MYFALTGTAESLHSLVVADVAPVRYRSGHVFGGYLDMMRSIEEANVESHKEADAMLETVVPVRAGRASECLLIIALV